MSLKMVSATPASPSPLALRMQMHSGVSERRIVRYFPPSGSNCSVREPELWPSFTTTARFVEELLPHLRMDILVPLKFQLYIQVPMQFQELEPGDEAATSTSTSTTAPASASTTKTTSQTRWALASSLPHGRLPTGPVVDIRVVAIPSPPSQQPLKVNGPWGPIWL